MNAAKATTKFFEMHQRGEHAVLDVNEATGQVICLFATTAETRCTQAPMPQNGWKRVAECFDGKLFAN